MKNLKLSFLILFLGVATFTFGQDEVPSVEVKTLEGQSVNIQEYAKNGKITVLNFWATWCSPCKRELDAISDVYEDWQDDYNMELLAISIDNARTFTRVKGMVEAKGWDYEVLSDIKRELQQALNFQDVPYTFVIDADGKIAYTHSGYNPGDEDELEEKLKDLYEKSQKEEEPKEEKKEEKGDDDSKEEEKEEKEEK